MSVRRLASLILHLPATSATGRRHQTDADLWTIDHELLATIAELVDAGSIRIAGVFRKKGRSLPKPVRIPRPWERRAGPLPMTDPRVRAFFGATVRYFDRDHQDN